MKPREQNQETDKDVKKAAPGTSTDQNEGEGSRSADRHYREGVEKTVKTGRVEELGEEAKEALEGEEGDELREAEQDAKRGKLPKGRPGQQA